MKTRKVLSLALTLALCLSLAVPAMAAEQATLTELAVLECDYADILLVADGINKIRTEGGWTFVDQKGQIMFTCPYEDTSVFSDGLVRYYNKVKSSGGGYMDAEGNVVISVEGNCTLGHFSEGLARISYGGGAVGYIDKTGKSVIPSEFEIGQNFSEGLAAVRKNGKWGYIDKTGRMVIPAEYEGAKNFHEGLAPVEKDGKCGYIDKTGKMVIPFQWDWITDTVSPLTINGGKYEHKGCFVEGMAMVMRDGKYGFIDTTGKEVIPPKYSEAWNFSDGMASTSWGYVDKTGAAVTPPENDYWMVQWDFYNGIACVRGFDGNLLINKKGETILEPIEGKEFRYSGGVLFMYDDTVHVNEIRLYSVSTSEIEPSEENVAVTPAPSETPAPATNTAYPSTQEVEVDGKAIEFQCYALKDAAGNDTNYIKLRDLADILNGSAAQFEVGWDGNITITTKTAYTKNGSEQNTPFSGQRAYEKTAVKTLVDGKETELDTFQLKDDAGGGYTYYKLRDLGKALGITVDWSAQRGIYIETK